MSSDVITKLNDQQIDQEHPLQSLMLRFRPGDKVRLTIIRDSQAQTVEVTLGPPEYRPVVTSDGATPSFISRPRRSAASVSASPRSI